MIQREVIRVLMLGVLFAVTAPTASRCEEARKEAELGSIYEAIFAPICSIRNFDVRVVREFVVLPTDADSLSRVRVLDRREERRIIHDLPSNKSFVLRKLTSEEGDLAEIATLDYKLSYFEDGNATYRVSSRFWETGLPRKRSFESFRTQTQLGLPHFMIVSFSVNGPYYDPIAFEATVGDKLARGTTVRELADGTRKVTREHISDNSKVLYSQTLDCKEFRILATSLVLEVGGRSIPAHSRNFEYADTRFLYLPTKIHYKSRETLKDVTAPDAKRIEGEESGTIELTWYRVNEAEPMKFPNVKEFTRDLKNWDKVLTTDELLTESAIPLVR